MTLNAAVNAGSGQVSLVNGGTEPINLGTKPPNTLGLLQSDLNQITAGTLRIGSQSDIGGMHLTAPIVAPAGWSTLHLSQGPAIDEQPTAGLTVTNLALLSLFDVDLTGSNNRVTNLAGAAEHDFHFTNSGPLTIASVDGSDGIGAAGAVCW